jgi:hypothetical protein
MDVCVVCQDKGTNQANRDKDVGFKYKDRAREWLKYVLNGIFEIFH